MRKFFLTLITFFLVNTAVAGWQSDIAENQIRAKSYISELRVNPNAKRPQLIVNDGWQSKRSLAEITSAINSAEQLSRAGRPDLIQMPQFQYGSEKSMREGGR